MLRNSWLFLQHMVLEWFGSWVIDAESWPPKTEWLLAAPIVYQMSIEYQLSPFCSATCDCMQFRVSFSASTIAGGGVALRDLAGSPDSVRLHPRCSGRQALYARTLWTICACHIHCVRTVWLKFHEFVRQFLFDLYSSNYLLVGCLMIADCRLLHAVWEQNRRNKVPMLSRLEALARSRHTTHAHTHTHIHRH